MPVDNFSFPDSSRILGAIFSAELEVLEAFSSLEVAYCELSAGGVEVLAAFSSVTLLTTMEPYC
jgi:hypothetical protein